MALGLALALSGCTSGAMDEPAPATPRVAATVAADLLDVDQFASLLDDPAVTVINVHVPYDGELPDTDAFVAFDEIVDAPELPQDRDAPVALYCRSGSMSRQAAAALVDAGYTDVRDLQGGMNAWQDAGRDLVFSSG